MIDLWEVLKQPEIPSSLRICAGTDGSVTLLIEVLTGKKVEVKTLEQEIITATPVTAKLLKIEEGDEVNRRIVVLTADSTVYVLAQSLSPLKRMPLSVKQDIMRADIPIGRILRNYRLETRRDIINIKLAKHRFFGELPVLSREYLIIYNKNILMWINECFPVDDRWKI